LEIFIFREKKAPVDWEIKITKEFYITLIARQKAYYDAH